MAKKSNYWYVLVCTDEGPKFVTKIHHFEKVAEWNETEAPLELSKSSAQDLAMGLTLNFNIAYAVCQSWQIDTHPFLYSKGHFVWQFKEEENDESDNNA